MTWRERLALLLGAASPFTASGPVMAAPSDWPRLQEGRETVALMPLEFWSDPAHADHALQLAQHRSHRSHSSHRSHVSGSGHASHYSGSTVTSPSPIYQAPAPVYTPPAPVYTPPTPRPPTPTGGGTSSTRSLPSTGTQQTPSGAPAGLTSSGRLTQDTVGKFVQRVQIALMVKGYDPGPADGELSPKTREALKAFQTATSLEVSGNMDVPTLNALGVLK